MEIEYLFKTINGKKNIVGDKKKKILIFLANDIG